MFVMSKDSLSQVLVALVAFLLVFFEVGSGFKFSELQNETPV
jgi:hypothetical protein